MSALVPAEAIKSYDLDFNWGPGGPNGFARPGLWAGADPTRHAAWYKAMGVNAIRDAVGTTGIDGFMVEWVRMLTTRASNQGRWLACEKKLYAELMGEPSLAEKQLQLPAAKMSEYGRRAVNRCWKTIRRAAKETNPACIVWLTCCNVNDPHIVDSAALRETDWRLFWCFTARGRGSTSGTRSPGR